MSYKIFFSDFDGTLTFGESLSPVFFDVLSEAKKHQGEFVIVTGRSLSWAHFLLTHFDLNYCITEGGGMISVKKSHALEDICLISPEEEKKLLAIVEKLKKYFPNLPLTTDSFGRRTDRAIDLFHLTGNKEKTDLKIKVEEFLDSEGAGHSTSSVHLNFWVGNLSKARASEEFMKRFFPSLKKKDCLFFGDGLNDQSMFAEFPYSVGVANVNQVLDRLNPKPSVILQGKALEGPSGVLHYLKEINYSGKVEK